MSASASASRVVAACLLIQLGFALVLAARGDASSKEEEEEVPLAVVDGLPKCVPITNPFCYNVGYNYTIENPRLNGEPTNGEITTSEITTDLQYWQSMLHTKCSKYLKQFICAAYNPVCHPTQAHFGAVGPCRRICEHVRKRCEPVLVTVINAGWPRRLQCDQFVETNGPNSFCMDFNISDEENEAAYQTDLTTLPPLSAADHDLDRLTKWRRPASDLDPSGSASVAVSANYDAVAASEAAVSRTLCAKMPRPENFVYNNRTDRCVLRCNANFLFTEEEKSIAQSWAVIMSGLCFASTFITAITIAAGIHQGRFRFPQRPVLLLAGCYCAMSLAYLIRFTVGRETVSCTIDSATQRKYLAFEGLDNAWCSLVFLFSYFFGLSGAAWWSLLALSLLLATAWRKSHDEIKHYASYFYMAGLGVPAVITIVVLVLRWVDADELMGTCYVGNHNPSALLYFVIIPHCVILLVGTTFLIIACAAQMRAKSRYSQSTRRSDAAISAPGQSSKPILVKKQDKLEATTVKISVYSAIGFIVPSTCVIACNLYEYLHFDTWRQSAKTRPAIELFMLRLSMLFMGGITTVTFIWSRKTITTWRDALSSLCCAVKRYDKAIAGTRSATSQRSQQQQQQKQLANPQTQSRTHGHAHRHNQQAQPQPQIQTQTHSSYASSFGTNRYDYELVRQDEKAREAAFVYAHSPCVMANGNIDAALAAAAHHASVHSFGSSANTNPNANPNPKANSNSNASSTSNSQSRMPPHPHLAAEYLSLSHNHNHNHPQLFGGVHQHQHPHPHQHQQFEAQMPDYNMNMMNPHAACRPVLQAHPALGPHRLSSADQLLVAAANYRSPAAASAAVAGNTDWRQPVALAPNVVAPPPSLVNLHVASNGYYVPTQSRLPDVTDTETDADADADAEDVPDVEAVATGGPVFSDGRRLPAHAQAFSAYNSAKNETTF